MLTGCRCLAWLSAGQSAGMQHVLRLASSSDAACWLTHRQKLHRVDQGRGARSLVSTSSGGGEVGMLAVGNASFCIRAPPPSSVTGSGHTSFVR